MRPRRQPPHPGLSAASNRDLLVKLDRILNSGDSLAIRAASQTVTVLAERLKADAGSARVRKPAS